MFEVNQNLLAEKKKKKKVGLAEKQLKCISKHLFLAEIFLKKASL